MAPDWIPSISLAGSKIFIGDTAVNENMNGTGFYELYPLIEGREIKIMRDSNVPDHFGIA